MTAYGSSAAAAVGAGTATVTVTTPSGSNGDTIAILCWANNTSATWSETGTSDFVQQNSDSSLALALFIRQSTNGSEAASYTFTRSATGGAAGVIIVRISAAGNYSVSGFASNNLSTSLPLPSVTSPATNSYSLQIASMMAVGSQTWTPPGTATEEADATASGSGVTYAIGDELVASGATGTRTWTHTTTSMARGVHMVFAPLVTGTLAATENADTVAASGTVTSATTGTLAATEAQDVVAVSATETITGTLTATGNQDTVAASGTETITGTLAAMESADTVVGSGTEMITGTLAYTGNPDTVAMSGTAAFTGTLAVTETADSVVASGTETITGTLAATEASDVVTIAGTVTVSVTGTLAATASDDGVSVVGTVIVPVTGTATVIEARDTVAMVGSGTTFTFFFEPPTHEEPIRSDVKPLPYYRLTWAASVIRIDGVLRSMRTPPAELLQAAGEEGIDYFRGGYIYEVSAETKAELEAAGYTVRAE